MPIVGGGPPQKKPFYIVVSIEFKALKHALSWTQQSC